ncbi:hypothetical protein IW967_03865 [Alicyclobacillus mali]|uniref:SWIM-type domain-containing protein n=1 Tax=Alicyclobacillus mali (ex Roth et al. 2021) TaxID=1123961 RepID=A0ABS0F131_9BACL|nr:hypothetical protein [Alicyclobacillus mali (ex Roth et al. 2021)]MBF8377013.1 hypothetical protein [Alicyclobacillus mali (ex Roth et al. 2021)]MCL6487914.1 hypothetical protein [Alicyclobacillus mali (ex Roth et al. 2021)]
MKRGPYASRWEPVLAEVDPSHLRAATRLAMSGAVRSRAWDGAGWRAVVERSGTRRAFDVWLPKLADYAGHARDVARWLAMRPDWLAAHYAGEWDESFLDFLSAHQVEVVPTGETAARLRALSTCTCEEMDPLCPHVVAVLLAFIWEADTNPLAAFRLVGIEVDQLLDLVQEETAALASAAGASGRTDVPGDWSLEEWRKDAPVRPLGRMRPIVRPEIRP